MNHSEDKIYVIAHKLYANPNNPKFGYVKPIFKIESGITEVATRSNFCDSEKVFINFEYDVIDAKFSNLELFLLEVWQSVIESGREGNCKYISVGEKATALSPRDLIEIVSAELPPPEDRILILNAPPLTPNIFIKDANGDFHGPFQYELEKNLYGKYDLRLITLSTPFPGLPILPGHVFKWEQDSNLSDLVVKATIGTSVRDFFTDPSSISQIKHSPEDYASDQELIGFGNELLKQINFRKNFTKNEVLQIKTDIAKAKKLPSYAINRMDRLFSLFREIDEWQAKRESVIKDYLASDVGKSDLESYLNEHEDDFFLKYKLHRQEQIDRELEEKLQKTILIEKRNAQLSKENEELNFKIQQRNQELISTPAQIQQNIESQYDEKINAKKLELEIIEAELAKLRDAHSLSIDVEKIKQKIQELESEERILQRRNSDLQLTQEGLSKTISSNDRDLRSRLLELKPFIDTINGLAPTQKGSDKSFKAPFGLHVASLGNIVEQRVACIRQVHEYLTSRNRSFTEEQVANFLITLQQSFVTVFAGLPGVGKTSLVKLLGDSLGLGPRTLNISVGRGWTSQRDLIGYYNPLNSSFQPASTGLYDLLVGVRNEEYDKQPPIFVLLDEANLSSIEHYWSSFIGMADREAEKKLHLGVPTPDGEIIVPESLRFIASINYDNTTESLSPRFIDRAAVVLLEAQDYQTEDDILSSLNELPAYTYSQLKAFFDISNEKVDFVNNEEATFMEIISILRDTNQSFGQQIHLSPRKISAIKRYCSVAGPIMKADSDLRALDYAICQHLLPLINGTGVLYSRRLEKLCESLNKYDLKQSYNKLKKIIETGKTELDSFSFFS